MTCETLSDTERTARISFFSGLLMPLASVDGVASQAAALGAQPLLPQERAIIVLVGRGYSNKRIGRQLGIVPGAVRSQLRCIFRKLRVQRRLPAYVRARELLALGDLHQAPGKFAAPISSGS